MNLKTSLKPAHHSERVIIESILNNTYPPGSFLPPERKLSEMLNVTRPTVRETLQRLSAEGWIEIHHGKPTEVNDFWKKGGMRLLGTMVKYGGYLPEDFILSLMEFRATLMPPIARLAILRKGDVISDFLLKSKHIEPHADAFVAYDWRLQEIMAHLSGNAVFPLILNDFAAIFKTLASLYFSLEIARNASLVYYDELFNAISNNRNCVETVVREALEKSIEIFNSLRSLQK